MFRASFLVGITIETVTDGTLVWEVLDGESISSFFRGFGIHHGSRTVDPIRESFSQSENAHSRILYFRSTTSSADRDGIWTVTRSSGIGAVNPPAV